MSDQTDPIDDARAAFWSAGPGNLDVGDYSHNDYLGLAVLVAAVLVPTHTAPEACGVTVQPGNGTRYGMICTPTDGMLLVDGSDVIDGSSGQAIVVAFLDFGDTHIFEPGYTDPSYAAEKIRLFSASDAWVAAAFLNAIWEVSGGNEDG